MEVFVRTARRHKAVATSAQKEDRKPLPEETIVKEIRANLEKAGINLHRYPISISLLNGDVILEGEAEDIAAKKLSLLTASETHKVQRIIDRLTVIPAEKMGDAEIRDHVHRALLEEPALERCIVQSGSAPPRKPAPDAAGSILIEVKDGVVTLNGEVPSLSHKRLAGVLAWWVPGSRDVVNGLEEVPPEEDNDDELIDAVRLVLEKDPFVNASKVRVSASDWVVTLEGLVPTETMKRMAERDAWYVLGVKKVVNKIEVKR
jgi:osmotically-inducible protein OsmY